MSNPGRRVSSLSCPESGINTRAENTLGSPSDPETRPNMSGLGNERKRSLPSNPLAGFEGNNYYKW